MDKLRLRLAMWLLGSTYFIVDRVKFEKGGQRIDQLYHRLANMGHKAMTRVDALSIRQHLWEANNDLLNAWGFPMTRAGKLPHGKPPVTKPSKE